MEDREYNDVEVSHLLSRYYSRLNTLKRYWGRLVQEGMRIAKEGGLTAIISENPELESADIVMPATGENVNADRLIELARGELPSLYRRYKEAEKAHIKDLVTLELLEDSTH